MQVTQDNGRQTWCLCPGEDGVTTKRQRAGVGDGGPGRCAHGGRQKAGRAKRPLKPSSHKSKRTGMGDGGGAGALTQHIPLSLSLSLSQPPHAYTRHHFHAIS